MKKLSLILILSILGYIGVSEAAWVGKLDLSPNVSPVMLRELGDGQWLAGLAKPDIWHLDKDDVQWAHAGIFHAWNAEKGNPSFGLMAGIDLPKAGPYISKLGKALELESVFKPLTVAEGWVSIEAFGGYRPVHTPDVKGNWVYGIGAKMNIKFGVKELQNGL